MISIIHPSRSRAGQSYRTAMSWISNAGCHVEHILSLDVDDPKIGEYATIDKKIVLPNKSAIEAINNAAQNARGDIFIVLSDDFECFPNWGKTLEILMAGQADWIIKTQDGIQEWVITLPIMEISYYQRFGYIYHPDYEHGWCDTEMTCVAELTGRKVVKNLFFKHNHHSVGGAKDSVSEKCDATFEQGRSVFMRRKAENFGLNKTEGYQTKNFYTML